MKSVTACNGERSRVAKAANVACLAAILLAMVSTGFSAPVARPKKFGRNKSFVGSPAGNFTLPDVHGGSVSLSDFRGKTVLLSFWATWCPPCEAELPTIQKIYKQDKSKGVAVLAVANEGRIPVANFLKAKHYDFTTLLDRKGTIFRKFAVYFIPAVFVINGQGVVVHEIVGWHGSQAILSAVKAVQ